MTTERALTEALRTVEDPDLGVDAVAGGIVREVTVEDGDVRIHAECAGLDPATREEVTGKLRRAAFECAGVESVTVATTDPASGGAATADPDSGGAATADPDSGGTGRADPASDSGCTHGDDPGAGPHDAGPGAPAGGPGASAGGPAARGDPAAEVTAALDGVDVVAVASAKGGVGKTTVATHLARGLAAEGRTVGVFDADLHGPNLPETIDVEGPVEADDEGRAVPVSTGDLRVLSVGLLAGDSPVAWRGSMAHEALLELLGGADWDDCDSLVIDLPPGTGDVVLTTLQSVPVDRAVLVTTPYPTAVEDTARSESLFAEEGLPVAGAVVNMAGFTCPDCGGTHDLFERTGVEEALEVPVLARVPFDDSLREYDEPSEHLDPVVDRVTDDDDLPPVPDGALDLRGVPERPRREQVRAEFEAVDPGDPFHVVADGNPYRLLSALEGVDARRIRRHGPGEWALSVRKARHP